MADATYILIKQSYYSESVLGWVIASIENLMMLCFAPYFLDPHEFHVNYEFRLSLISSVLVFPIYG